MNLYIETHEAIARAAEARHGGRLITRYLADIRSLRSRDILAGNEGPEALRTLWDNALSPSGGRLYLHGSRESTLVVARSYADNGGSDASYRSQTILRLDQVEAMIEWPVYRAAVLAQTRDVVDSTGSSTMRGLSSHGLDQLDELGERGVFDA